MTNESADRLADKLFAYGELLALTGTGHLTITAKDCANVFDPAASLLRSTVPAEKDERVVEEIAEFAYDEYRTGRYTTANGERDYLPMWHELKPDQQRAWMGRAKNLAARLRSSVPQQMDEALHLIATLANSFDPSNAAHNVSLLKMIHDKARSALRSRSVPQEPRGTDRDRIAFEAGWIAHETASATEGIGGSEMQCAAAFREWCPCPAAHEESDATR